MCQFIVGDIVRFIDGAPYAFTVGGTIAEIKEIISPKEVRIRVIEYPHKWRAGRDDYYAKIKPEHLQLFGEQKNGREMTNEDCMTFLKQGDDPYGAL